MNAVHIVVDMKPIEGNFADNALELGVAGVNIDDCRIEGKPRTTHKDGNIIPNGPQTYTQRRNAEKYANKEAALSRLGIPLFEIWEIDIKEDLSLAVSKVMKDMGVSHG